jgi:hypothetical protein
MKMQEEAIMRAVITIPGRTLMAIVEQVREGETVDDQEASREEESTKYEAEGDDVAQEAATVDEAELDGADGEDVELDELFDNLGPGELSEILALAWIGEGNYDRSDWNRAVEAARGVPPDDILVLLDNKPNLGEAIEAALMALGLGSPASDGAAE